MVSVQRNSPNIQLPWRIVAIVNGMLRTETRRSAAARLSRNKLVCVRRVDVRSMTTNNEMFPNRARAFITARRDAWNPVHSLVIFVGIDKNFTLDARKRVSSLVVGVWILFSFHTTDYFLGGLNKKWFSEWHLEKYSENKKMPLSCLDPLIK